MKNKMPRLVRLLLTAALALSVGLVSLYCVYMIWETPPERETAPLEARADAALPPQSAEPTEIAATATPEPTGAGGVYTLLLVGNDDGNGNTDALLLCRLDTGAHSLRVLSIPRDTLVNADWEVRKINAVYWGDRLYGGDGIGALRRHVAMLTGFAPNNYAVLDLSDLVTAVDLLGGVRFDVPMAMHYDDASQNLHIRLEPGEQTLSGEQAMWLCRYRSGYVSGDLGRIEMQQQFLRAALEQFAELGKVPNLMQAAEYLAGAVDTDLTAANMAWYARQMLLCRDDVQFLTLPTENATVHGYSYAVVSLSDWLAMLNGSLNPFERDLTAEDLDLVYRAGGAYVGTKGLRGSWYYARTANAATPEESPLPALGPRIIAVMPGKAV